MLHILKKLFCGLVLLIYSHVALARTVMLNGVDISSARNQSLENVNIRIDPMGNVYIDAPHYSVHQENTFLPLGTQSPSAQNSRHKNPGVISSELGQAQGQMLPKAEQANARPESPAQATSVPKANDGKLAPKEGEKIQAPTP